MIYTVIFDNVALDYLSTLPKDIGERIFNKIRSTKENPFHYFDRLVGSELFKLRVGDYRVLADIDESLKIINVRFIGHRKNVYKN